MCQVSIKLSDDPAGQVYCIFLFLTSASLFGTLVSQVGIIATCVVTSKFFIYGPAAKVRAYTENRVTLNGA